MERANFPEKTPQQPEQSEPCGVTHTRIIEYFKDAKIDIHGGDFSVTENTVYHDSDSNAPPQKVNTYTKVSYFSNAAGPKVVNVTCRAEGATIYIGRPPERVLSEPPHNHADNASRTQGDDIWSESTIIVECGSKSVYQSSSDTPGQSDDSAAPNIFKNV